ncbi:hypothetical protein [Aliiroseovarius sp.]|uniref:hypothetical protein n=1 Tax=Aliiroseovarius sp. TaxID=1872442 RepID=UPI00260CAA89|nr:hypothetical protein [Aliiroseovarius sp.]
MKRFLILALFAAVTSGCSVLAYTPVVGAAMLGKDRVPVSSESAEAGVIGKRLQVPAGSTMSLRAFEGGRMFLSDNNDPGGQTRLVCPLAGRTLVVTRLYEDQINGGTHYDAQVICGGESFEAKRSLWSADLLAWPEV